MTTSETTQSSTTWSGSHRIWSLGLGFLAALFALYALGLIEHNLSLLQHPRSVDYGETPEIARAWSIHNGGTMYPAWDSLPLVIANYTPLYSTVNSFFIGWTGPTPFTGRLISMLSFLLSAGLLVRLLQTLGRPIALLAGGLFLSGHMVWAWSGLVRVDGLALLFQLGALVLAQAWTEGRAHRRSIWMAVLLCLLAAWTRQTMIASFAAIMTMLVVRDRRLALQALGLYAGLGSALLGVLLWMTDGWAWQHMVVANVNEYSTEILRSYLHPAWTLYHWMLPFLCLGLWSIRRKPLLLTYCIAAMLTVLLIGKIGSSLNYLLEAWVAACILTAHSLRHINPSRWSSWLSLMVLLYGWQQLSHVPYFVSRSALQTRPAWQTLLTAQQLLPLWRLSPLGKEPALHSTSQHYVPAPGAEQLAQLSIVEDLLKDIEGPIFSENLQFTLAIGKAVSVQPFVITQLARQRVLNPSPWYDCLEAQCFAAVVLTFPLEQANQAPSGVGWHLTPRSVQLMSSHYQLHPLSPVSKHWIYVPRSDDRR